MDLILLQFKNYFDRRIQRFDNLEDYDDYIIDKQYNVNFIPGDGISTSVIVNSDTTVVGVPDYLLAVDQYHISRWFVMSSERTRKGQTKLTLRRDLIAEEIDGIKSATSMVNKGYVQFGSDATFFSPEQISVNEIPQSTTGLYQIDNCAWLVAYVPKHSGTEETDKWENTSVDYGQSGSDVDYYDEIAGSHEDIKKELGEGAVAIPPIKLQGMDSSYVTFNVTYSDATSYIYRIHAADPTQEPEIFQKDNNYFFTHGIGYIKSSLDTYDTITALKSAVSSTRQLLLSKVLSDKGLTGFNEVAPGKYLSLYNYDNGKVIKAKDLNTYYKVTKENISLTAVNQYTNNDWKNQLVTILNNRGLDTSMLVMSSGTGYSFSGHIKALNVNLDQISSTVAKFTIDKTRRSCVDAPYDIIAMPYVKNGGDFKFTIDGVEKTCHTSYNMSLASNLSSSWGTSVVYDAQLLPYAPVSDIFKDNKLTLNSSGSGVIYNWNADTLVLYLGSVNSTFDIDYTIECSGDKKDYICDKYKLVAPNYSGEYDLPVFENGGIDGFNVDITLFPYSPWIKINPIYKMFNGNDLDDVRGLVLGGSFSITQTSSAWTEYVYNNSNYSQIFASQMAYQEYLQKNQLISSSVSVPTNALSNEVTGALIGGPVGAAVMGGLSLGAGISDLITQKQMNEKANEYTRTQHQLQLGNIKSKPNTISKITSININNKLVPQVVYYSCTSDEKSAVSDYLRLYGMSINKIDKIENYMKENYYISAAIIDAPNIKGDANYKNQIKQEVQQGFFYKEA